MTLWYGSGSSDPYLWHVSGCRFGRPKNILILRIRMRVQNTGTFYHYSQLKVKKKLQKSGNQRFSYYFCVMMEGSGAGSVLVTNGSGCGSGSPKNIRIWIPNTGTWNTCWTRYSPSYKRKFLLLLQYDCILNICKRVSLWCPFTKLASREKK